MWLHLRWWLLAWKWHAGAIYPWCQLLLFAWSQIFSSKSDCMGLMLTYLHLDPTTWTCIPLLYETSYNALPQHQQHSSRQLPLSNLHHKSWHWILWKSPLTRITTTISWKRNPQQKWKNSFSQLFITHKKKMHTIKGSSLAYNQQAS